MLRVTDRSTPTCLVVEAWGRITRADYEDLDAAFTTAIKQHGTIDLVLLITGNVSYDGLNIPKHERDAWAERYRHVRRIAIVGANTAMKAAMRFSSENVRTFDAHELEAAIEWACGSRQ